MKTLKENHFFSRVKPSMALEGIHALEARSKKCFSQALSQLPKFAWATLIILVITSCGSDPRTDRTYLQQNRDGRALSSYEATGTQAMIASAGPEATQAGLEVLKKGGNAIDAAIAVSFAISVLRPQSTGIGGGGFMLAYHKQKDKTFVFDFREQAPLKSRRNMYVKDAKVVPGLSMDGPWSVATPGLVAGLVSVHKELGSLPWKTLLEPAIALAEKGFTVYPALTTAIENRKDVILKNSAMAQVFLKEGQPLRSGKLLIQTDLAKTLRAIADHGHDGFYKGWVAQAITLDMKRLSGQLTQADLDRYRVKQRPPVTGTYRGYTVVSMPPPSSGGTHIVQMLNMLEEFDLPQMGFKSEPHIHLLTEVMRQAYADRAQYLGDPDFVNVPVDHLTSKTYAKASAQKIDLTHARTSQTTVPGNFKPLESASTTHFSIVDAQGNAVSSTQTINYTFGSCVMAAGTGVILNDEMDDFSAQPGVPNAYGLVGGEANAIAPLKRPLSSMSPTIVFKKGRPFLVVGSPGGSRIITAVLQTIVNVLDFGVPLLHGVAHGRIHHQWLPDELFIEHSALSNSTQRNLSTMGHTLSVKSQGDTLGDVQAILIQDDGTLVGVSDPRGEGQPLGY